MMTAEAEALLDDAIASKIAWLDARTRVPAADLAALDIDRAEMRWDAVRDYIAELREVYTRKLNRAFVLMVAVRYAERSAARQTCDHGGCALCRGFITMLDLLDAVVRVKARFGHTAAKIVAEEFFPPVLHRLL